MAELLATGRYKQRKPPPKRQQDKRLEAFIIIRMTCYGSTALSQTSFPALSAKTFLMMLWRSDWSRPIATPFHALEYNIVVLVFTYL